MNKLSTTVSLVDVIGLCSFFDQTDKIGNKVVILDNVQDPGNVGTIIERQSLLVLMISFYL
jgi:TrmH family RNA methyltransferase